jgi:hypothetical protein
MFKNAIPANISREYQILLIYRRCIFVGITLLHNSKQVSKLHLDRLSEKLLPYANYGTAIYWMQEVQLKISPSIGLERW